MHQIIDSYRLIIFEKNKAKKYGMKLQNQAFSHYFLLRHIGAAISFEIVK